MADENPGPPTPCFVPVPHCLQQSHLKAVICVAHSRRAGLGLAEGRLSFPLYRSILLEGRIGGQCLPTLSSPHTDGGEGVRKTQLDGHIDVEPGRHWPVLSPRETGAGAEGKRERVLPLVPWMAECDNK